MIRYSSYLSLILSLLFLATTVCAQFSQLPDSTSQQYIGGKRADAIYAIQPTLDGKMVGVGQSKFGDRDQTKRKKKKQAIEKGGNDDILFFLMNEKGTVEVIKAFGLENKEGAYAVTPTFDGGYVVAGFTTTHQDQQRTDKDGLILKLDQEGILIWHQQLGTTSLDEFRDVIQLANGDIVACGRSQDQGWIVKLNRKGESSTEKNIFVEDKSTVACAIAELSDGTIGVTGIANSKRKEYTFYRSLNTTLNPAGAIKTFFNRLPDNRKSDDLKNSVDLVVVSDNELALVSPADSKSENMQIGLVFLDNKGTILEDRKGKKREYYPSQQYRNETTPFGVILGTDAHLYIAGASKAHRQGKSATQNKFFMAAINIENGKNIWDNFRFYGGNFDDRAYGLMQNQGNNLFLAGLSKSKNAYFGGGKDGLLIKTKPISPINSRLTTEVIISKKRLIEDSGDGLLEPNERGYYQFELNNPSDQPLVNIRLDIERYGGSNKIDFPKELFLGIIPPKTSKRFSIPIRGLAALSRDRTSFQVHFQEKNAASIPMLEFEIQSKEEAQENLQIVESNTSLLLQKEQEIELSFFIKNKGDLAAHQVEGYFHYEHANIVTSLSKQEVVLGTIEAGEQKEISFKFKISRIFQKEALTIKFMYSSTRIQRYDKVIPFTYRTDPEEPTHPDQLTYDVEIFWDDPTEEVINSKNSLMTVPFKIRMREGTDITKNDVYLKHNNRKIEHRLGGKSGEQPLRRKSVKEEKGFKVFRFEVDLELEKGKNTLEVSLNKENSEIAHPPKIIHYFPGLPNLHFIGIGIGKYPSTNIDSLQYTSNDVLDVFNALKKQEGKTFGRVSSDYLLCDSFGTNITRLKVTRLMGKFMHDKENIPKEDLIVMFISSHGKAIENDFYIMCSDRGINPYDNETEGLVNFRTDILEHSQKLKNKWFFFVDACFSGAIKKYDDEYLKAEPQKEQAKVLYDILNTESLLRVRTIMSCSSDENSHEHRQWENGAFTEGLLEAFENKTVDMGKGEFLTANKNGDKILSYNELYRFLQKRVPYLVKQQFENLKQTPYIPKALLLEDMNFFLLD